jgi:hypothetical protein
MGNHPSCVSAFAEAFAVNAGVELKSDIPGWIREF